MREGWIPCIRRVFCRIAEILYVIHYIYRKRQNNQKQLNHHNVNYWQFSEKS